MLKINTILTLIIAAGLFYPALAQQNQTSEQETTKNMVNIERGIANYQKALESDNAGMMESAIINIMRLKYTSPDFDYQTLIEPLQNLEVQGPTKSIRFMAYIVKNYLIYPERYTWVEDLCCKQGKMFFALMGDKIHAQVHEE